MQEREREGPGWGWAALAGVVAVLAVLVAPRTEGPTEGRKIYREVETRVERLAASYRALPVPPPVASATAETSGGRGAFAKAAERLYVWLYPEFEDVDVGALGSEAQLEALVLGGRPEWRRARHWVDGLSMKPLSPPALARVLNEAAPLARPVELAVRTQLSAPGPSLLDTLLPPGHGVGLDAIGATTEYLRLASLSYRLEERLDASLDASLRGLAFVHNQAALAGAIRERVVSLQAAPFVMDLELLLTHERLDAAQLERLAEGVAAIESALPSAKRERLTCELVFHFFLIGSYVDGPTGREPTPHSVRGYRADLRPSAAELAVRDANGASGELLRALWVTSEKDDHPHTFATVLADTWDLRLRLQTRLRLLATHVAIQRFEREQGQRPTSLDSLVPRWLPATPTCAYSEQPLRFDGQRVWAYGQDADDDGGLPLQWSYDGPRPQDGDLISVLPDPPLGPLPSWFDATRRAQVDAITRDAVAYTRAEARWERWVESDQPESSEPPEPVLPEVMLEDLVYDQHDELVDALARAVLAASEGNSDAYLKARLLDAALRSEHGFLAFRHGDWRPLTEGDPHERYVQVATRWWIWAASGWPEIEQISAYALQDLEDG